MSAGAVGFILFIAISTITAAAMHRLLPRLFITSLIAAILSTAIFQGLAYLHDGYPDPFLSISLLAGGALACAIALLVGLMFRANRKASKTKR